jgi:hypothetical protein
MNEAEQTSRLHSMNEKELVKWEKHLIRDIADIQATIADTDRGMNIEGATELVSQFPAMLDKHGTVEEFVAFNRAFWAGTQSRRHARMITRQRRLAQIQRRLADVRSGAPLSSTPAPVDKDAQRIWRRLVADRREAMLYVAYAEKRQDQRGLAVFQAKVDKLDQQMREIAEGAK